MCVCVCVCSMLPTLSGRRGGDAEVVAEHGSLHQYLRHCHAKDGAVIAF